MKFLSGISLSLFLIFWEAAVQFFRIPSWILPGPIRITVSFWQAKELIWYHTQTTLLEAFFGLTLAVLFALLLSLIIDWSQLFRKIIYPFLVISQTIPFITLAPLLAIWLGYNLSAKIVVVCLVCFFPITVSLSDGFGSVDKNMLRLMHSFNADNWQIFRLVKIPASLPFFFSGLRIAATYAILTAVMSEWIGAGRGLGIFLIRSAKSYRTDRVFAVIFVISLLSLIAVFITERLAKFIAPWHYHKTFH